MKLYNHRVQLCLCDTMHVCMYTCTYVTMVCVWEGGEGRGVGEGLFLHNMRRTCAPIQV